MVINTEKYRRKERKPPNREWYVLTLHPETIWPPHWPRTGFRNQPTVALTDHTLSKPTNNVRGAGVFLYMFMGNLYQKHASCQQR